MLGKNMASVNYATFDDGYALRGVGHRDILLAAFLVFFRLQRWHELIYAIWHCGMPGTGSIQCFAFLQQ